MHIDVAGSEFMNGASVDENGNLFVTDMNKNCVYRILLTSGTYNVFNEDLSSPNGLHFDKPNNAILVCSWGGNAKIQSISLTDSSLTDLVSTKMSDLDGICSDNCGNIYVSSWGKNAVFVFEPTFSKPPTKIAEGLNGPADIAIREDNQTLLVPNFNSNSFAIIELGINCAKAVSYSAPAKESTDLETTVTVEWKAVEGATSYNIEYGTDEMFYSTVGIKATEHLSADLEELEFATTYFWRVAAIIDDTKTIYSDAWSFTTVESNVDIQNLHENEIKIYPNPCDNTLNFSEAVNNVSITNVAGQQVYSAKPFVKSINFDELTTGLYFVEFYSSENIKIITKLLQK
jgi:DNA-binding beta-propeller fold protein YncE